MAGIGTGFSTGLEMGLNYFMAKDKLRMEQERQDWAREEMAWLRDDRERAEDERAVLQAVNQIRALGMNERGEFDKTRLNHETLNRVMQENPRVARVVGYDLTRTTGSDAQGVTRNPVGFGPAFDAEGNVAPGKVVPIIEHRDFKMTPVSRGPMTIYGTADENDPVDAIDAEELTDRLLASLAARNEGFLQTMAASRQSRYMQGEAEAALGGVERRLYSREGMGGLGGAMLGPTAAPAAPTAPTAPRGLSPDEMTVQPGGTAQSPAAGFTPGAGFTPENVQAAIARGATYEDLMGLRPSAADRAVIEDAFARAPEPTVSEPTVSEPTAPEAPAGGAAPNVTSAPFYRSGLANDVRSYAEQLSWQRDPSSAPFIHMRRTPDQLAETRRGLAAAGIDVAHVEADPAAAAQNTAGYFSRPNFVPGRPQPAAPVAAAETPAAQQAAAQPTAEPPPAGDIKAPASPSTRDVRGAQAVVNAYARKPERFTPRELKAMATLVNAGKMNFNQAVEMIDTAYGGDPLVRETAMARILESRASAVYHMAKARAEGANAESFAETRRWQEITDSIAEVIGNSFGLEPEFARAAASRAKAQLGHPASSGMLTLLNDGRTPTVAELARQDGRLAEAAVFQDAIERGDRSWGWFGMFGGKDTKFMSFAPGLVAQQMGAAPQSAGKWFNDVWMETARQLELAELPVTEETVARVALSAHGDMQLNGGSYNDALLRLVGRANGPK